MDVKIQGKCLSILSSICLFVSLFAHAIVRAYRVRVFKKTKVTCRFSGRVSGCQTKRPYVFFLFFFFVFSIAKILLKLCGCTCTCRFGTLLVMCILGRRSIFHVNLFIL